MSKREYTVNEGNKPPSKCATWFKPCVAFLLVFIAICVLILLMKSIWTKDSPATGEYQPLGSDSEVNTSKSTTMFVPKSVPTKSTTQYTIIRETVPSNRTETILTVTPNYTQEPTKVPEKYTTPILFTQNTTKESSNNATLSTFTTAAPSPPTTRKRVIVTTPEQDGETTTKTTLKGYKDLGNNIDLTTENTDETDDYFETQKTTIETSKNATLPTARTTGLKTVTTTKRVRPTVRITETNEFTTLVTTTKSTDETEYFPETSSRKNGTLSTTPNGTVSSTTSSSEFNRTGTTPPSVMATTVLLNELPVQPITTTETNTETVVMGVRSGTEEKVGTTESLIGDTDAMTVNETGKSADKRRTTGGTTVMISEKNNNTATEGKIGRVSTTEMFVTATENIMKEFADTSKTTKVITTIDVRTVVTTAKGTDMIIKSNDTTTEAIAEFSTEGLEDARNNLTTVQPTSTTDLLNYEVGEASIGAYDESTEDYSSDEINETTITSRNRTIVEGTSSTEANIRHPILSMEPELTCPLPECKSAASRMLSLMDHSINPCADFYEYSCGGMQTKNPDWFTWNKISHQLYLINNKSSPYLQTFKTFHNSCVSFEHNFNYQDRISGVQKLVKEVGEIVDDNTAKSTIDLTPLFINLILRQSHPFMDVDLDVEDSTNKFILKLTPPKATSILKESGRWSALTETQMRCLDEQRHKLEQLNLDLTEIYESYLTCQKNHTIYLNSIETVVRALGFYSHLNNNQNQQIRDVLLEILNILPSASIIKKEGLFKDFTVLTISEIQAKYPMVQWKTMFRKITNKRYLDENVKVHVYFSPYFKRLLRTLQTIPKWKLNNVLIALYATNLYENLVIPQARHDREDYCLKLSSQLFHDVSSNLYMKGWPENHIKGFERFSNQIFDRLKQNLTTALQQEKWLDPESKQSAILKLEKLKIVNNPLTIYKYDAYFQSKYKSAVMTTDFQDNVVKMLQINRKMRFGLLGENCTTDYLWSYFINAYDDKPSSFYAQGFLMAPLGMVKHPVKGLPGYVTMAQIGLSLAKEIGRHFDPIGIQRGMNLTRNAQFTYKYLESVMENESFYNVTKFVLHHSASIKADPKLSMKARIADNTAFRLISDSFEDFGDQILLPWVSTSFTQEQIFYITAAQESCQHLDVFEFMEQLFESDILPAPLQVENMVRNSKQFASAFFCPLDAPMSNNHRRMQFPHLLEQDNLL